MKSRYRRLTVRALVVWIALFAVNFGGITWYVRRHLHGPRVGDLILRGDHWSPVNPLLELVIGVACLTVFPFLLLFTRIGFYVPPRLQETVAVVLILILLLLLIMPAMQHSRSVMSSK